MKRSFAALAFSLAFATAVLAQQSTIIGKWTGEFPGQNGQPAMKFSLTISDNAYQMDIGMDGTADITGAYTSDGKQITIWDTAGENICPSDQKGVYTFVRDGDTLTFTKVTDSCPGRGNAPLVVKKM